MDQLECAIFVVLAVTSCVVLTDEAPEVDVTHLGRQLGVERVIQSCPCLLKVITLVFLEELVHQVVDIGEGVAEPVLDVVRA